MLIVATFALLWMRLDNKRRDRLDIEAELTSLNQQQVEDLDWKHPAFRWKP
jgi:hypothetical protein